MNPGRPPLWVTILIIIFLLPVTAFPVMLNHAAPGSETLTFVWIYPFYMLLSAWLAYNAYASRSYITVVLLALMALSTAALWILLLNPETLEMV